ncbi:MAG: hypothetical protein LBV70_06250, partial [Candidatus Adiutrix sp.]|jgi:hypothetical protein|nr:hypothetical protein [Candidatus Adiutrix sp.]
LEPEKAGPAEDVTPGLEPEKAGPAEDVTPGLEPEKAGPGEDVTPGLEPEKADTAEDVPPGPEPSPSHVTTREQVNEYLAPGSGPTPQGAMELAGQLKPSSAEEQDEVYRLWLFADDAAALDMARAEDPSLPPWGSIVKDGAKAWSLYKKAAAKQPAAAAEALNALKRWLEEEAGRGNRKAVGWIDRIAEDSAK